MLFLFIAYIIFISLTFGNSSLLISRLSKWAGKVPEEVLLKSIRSISFKDLSKYLTKTERIDFLLEKAYYSNRLSSIDVYRLRYIYSKIPNGDKFLLLCLKDVSCNPFKFAKRANTWLYQRLIKEFPEISTAYELEKKIIPEIYEKFTIKFFEKSGWKCINGKYKGNNGFDGLCIKTNWFGNVKDVLILETKAGSSRLGTAKCGQQMSYSCIIDTLSLLNEKEKNNMNFFIKLLGLDNNKYKQIINLVKNGKYRRRLIRIEATGNELIIKITHLEDSADKTKIKLGETEVIKANLANPQTSTDFYVRKLFEKSLEEIRNE
jgi:hypothetical protein